MSSLDDDTDVPVPWTASRSEPREPIPHLVVAWLYGEPERVGQVAPIGEECWLGRAHDAPADFRFAQFFEQRPGESLATADLETKVISRRQLRLSPLGPECVHVQNTGKAQLFHNGARVRECNATPGDTLMLEHAAVFLLEARPRALSLRSDYPGIDFRFGYADPHGMIGESPAAWDLRDQLAAAASQGAHGLLLGESGVGKELAARALHGLSARSAGAFVARNAATIPATLVDAELFGTAKNYPNSGAPERVGLVGEADGGHLMLDEIGELPEVHQAHLLRLLDRGGEYHRLGESRTRISDLRLIAATNRDPGSLKHDLLARFTHLIYVPGLNERRADIPFLVRELVRRMAAESPELLTRFCDQGKLEGLRMEAAFMEALLRHHYVTHTRELDRYLHLSVATSTDQFLALTAEVAAALLGAEAVRAGLRMSQLPPAVGERATADDVTAALSAADGNVTHAANRLGISRHALRRLLKKYELSAEMD